MPIPCGRLCPGIWRYPWLVNQASAWYFFLKPHRESPMSAFQEYFDASHQLVRDSVRRFVEREILPHIDDWEEAEEFPRELYLKAGAAGILGIGYPEQFGGSNQGDVFAKVAASEELMRSGSGGLVAGLGSLDIGLPPIVKWARPQVRDRVVPLVLIEKGTPGFNVGRKLKKMGWWASDTAELFFDDCLVPVENLIGAENMGFACIMANFQSERLSLAIMANMTAQLALEESLTWARERQAFGKPIGKFQVLKHRLAEMATQLEVSREFTYRQAAKMAAGKSVIKEISMAKNFATDIADRLTYDAVQIMGGMGYMRESLVERLYRDNRILSIGGGSREIMNEIISKQMGL